MRASAARGPRGSGERDVLRCKIPVEELVDYRLDIVGTEILGIEVVRVLPDVDGEQRDLAARERQLGAGRRSHLELVVVQHEPGPAAAELLDRSVNEYALEHIEPAECGLQALTELARRLAAAARLEAAPVERVVPRLRRV